MMKKSDDTITEPAVLTLRKLHECLTEALKEMTGDEPVAIAIDGDDRMPMPVSELRATGLKLFSDGRRRGARIERDEEAECDCGVFLISHPMMIGEGYWHRTVAELAGEPVTKD